MIRVSDQYFWNVVFSVFFVILIVMGVIILESESRISYEDLTLLDYAIISLASWRLIRLFVHDSLTRFFREQFMDVVKVGRGYRLEKPKAGPRRAIADLLSCSWCFGMWAAATVLFFYLLTPYAIFPVTLLALSAVATALQIAVNLLGYSVERVKKQSELL